MAGAGAPARFSLRHARGETAIVCGDGALAAALPDLAAWVAGRALFIVSTPRVRGLHGRDLVPLGAAAARVVDLTVPEGEEAKTLAHAERLWREMVAAGGRRDSRLACFGGGSVGDLGGLCAACFLRGIEFVQLPTTLLAQVDAAVGGKTAVDLPEAKNSVGVFHHPAFVVAEASWLETLPQEEVRSGLVEAVKTAILDGPGLFARCERDLPALLAGDLAALAPVVAGAARAKAAVVESDPEESGRRRVLNLGHTLGHALETTAAYRGLRHGEAVGWGILFATRLSARLGISDPVDGRRIEELLGRLGLPGLPPGLDAEGLLALMGRDKKAVERGLRWVLPVRLGEVLDAVAVAHEVVAGELASWLAEARQGTLSPGSSRI